MTISQRIFALLKEKKLKQKDLALSTGVSEQAISDWKKKGTNPSAEYISAIADFLKVSTDYLLTGKEAETAAHSADEEDLLALIKDLSLEEREYLGRFMELSDTDKARIMERIDAMLESYPREAKDVG